MFFKILIMSVLIFADSEPKQSRAVSQKQILDGCVKSLNQAPDKEKQICECVVANLSIKANDYQLQILAREYSGKGGSVSGELGDYDVKVADGCLADPKWRMKIESTDGH